MKTDPAGLGDGIQLRDYQLAGIAALRSNQVWKRRPILVAPCGSGKTTIASEVIRQAIERGNPCIFLVHRIELLDQAVERLAQLGIQAGTIIAGRKATAATVQVASIQTLARREPPPASVVIVDECNHAVSPSWKKLIDHYAASGAAIIGITATPYRLDGKGLGAVFGEIVVVCSASDLIARGLLVQPRIWAPPPPDLSGIRTIGGDYQNDDLAERMSKPGVIGRIVEHYQKHAAGKRTIGFAVNVAHSQYLCQLFNENNIPSAHVDAKTPRAERAAAAAKLATGEITVLWNVQVYTEGWDMPSLECAIMARPTKSLALWVQMQGRVMRACDGKDGAIVLDHAGNVRRLGLVTDELEYSLHDRVKRKDGSVPSVRTCPACFAVIPDEVTVCPECKEPLQEDEAAREARKATHIDGELVEFKREDPRQRYAEIIALGNLTNRRLGWARHAYRAQFGSWPKLYSLERELYVCKSHEPEAVTFGARTLTRCARCLRDLDIQPPPAREWDG